MMTTMMMLRMSRRSLATTAVLRVPSESVVQSVMKSNGDSCSFGEPVAIVRAAGVADAISLAAPVNGQVVQVKAKVGDTLRPESEVAVFQGRQPLIQFRHLKGSLGFRPSSTSAAPAPSPKQNELASPTDAPAPARPAQQQTATKGPVVRKTFLEVPSNYGRLPPLSAKEIALLHSGGAYDA